MEKGHIFKKAVSIAAAAAALFTAIALPSPNNTASAEGDSGIGLPTRLMNGDFERPYAVEAIDKASLTQKNQNGTTRGTYSSNSGKRYTISNDEGDNPDIIYRYKDPWFVTTNDIFNDISADQNEESFYWETTAFDERIELVAPSLAGSDSVGYFPDGTAAAGGRQFAELVGTEESSLYQNIQTTPGNSLTWKLQHRARSAGNDSMAVFIGPRQDGLKKSSKNAQDIFNKMAELITENDGELTQPGMSSAARKIYSSEITDGMAITNAAVSTSKTETCDQEWTCWIITSGSDKWNEYSGVYRVPDGQAETTMAFTALSSSNGSLNGNCLDSIEFGIQYPLTVSAMQGGKGTVSGGGITETEVEHFKTFNGSANEGSEVTLTALPQTYPSGGTTVTYEFLGAVINGEHIGIGENGFKKQDNGSYTYVLTMDEAKNAELLFASTGEVKYDLSGGRWKNDHTVYKLNSDTRVEQSVVPELEGSSFIRWDVYAANGTTSLNGTVGSEHTITYNHSSNSFTVTDESGTQKFGIAESASEYAIVLRAVYTHTVSVQSCTRYFGSNEVVHDDAAGGTVTAVNNSAGGENGSAQISVTDGNRFTVTAIPNDGFTFDSWWYSYKNDNGDTVTAMIPDAAKDSYTANFNGSRSIEIHAQFSELPADPYLAAAAKDAENAEALKDAGIDTDHGKVLAPNGRGYIYSNGAYGGDKYGNTISTGFFIKRRFTDTENDTVKLSGTWTINIPALDTYFKIADKDVFGYGHIDTDPAVENDSAETGAGAVYKAAENNDNSYNKQVKFYVDGTTVTGESNVVFGIVIDDLYAPNAQAGFRPGDNSGNAPVLDETNSVTADKYKPYDQSELDSLTNTQN